jgi:hypothetical protein
VVRSVTKRRDGKQVGALGRIEVIDASTDLIEARKVLFWDLEVL